MSNNESSFGNNPVAYTGALSTILASLIRMFCPTEYIENVLTISSAASPIIGLWIFSLLNDKKRSDSQKSFENRIKTRMDFLDKQLDDNSYTDEQKKIFVMRKLN